MNLTKFNELFITNITDLTGYVLIVANGTIEVNGTELNDTEMQNIKAMMYVLKTKYVWVPARLYSTKKWVNTSGYRWVLRSVWVLGHWAHWGPISIYIRGHYELRLVKVYVKSGYWKTTWHYKPGYWKKVSYKVQLNIPAKTSKILITARNGINNGALNNNAMLFTTKPYLNYRPKPTEPTYYSPREKKIVGGALKIVAGLAITAGGSVTPAAPVTSFVGYSLVIQGSTDLGKAFEIIE